MELKYKGKRKNGKFVKGYSGNPSGMKKGTVSVVAELRRQLKESIKDKDGKKIEKLVLLGNVILKKAIAQENIEMIKDLIDRIDGKPKESKKIEGELGVKNIRELIEEANND